MCTWPMVWYDNQLDQYSGVGLTTSMVFFGFLLPLRFTAPIWGKSLTIYSI